MKSFFQAIVLLLLSSCSTDRSIIDRHSDKSDIEKHLMVITKTEGFRNYQNSKVLNFVADYIYKHFEKYCDTVYYQTYTVNGVEYKNVVGSIGPKNSERIIVGAHYDVCGEQEGADDNASGVVGLLELAQLLKGRELKYRIDFVAYSLEEPPFFRTHFMGSYVHAKSLNDAKVRVKGMICLEMIGYFSDKPKSQEYPLPHKTLIYGDKANYIMIVEKMGNNGFADDVKGLMKNAEFLDTKSIKAPSIVTGIDFSDHRNYWEFGYSALMITNTSFYRKANYHEPTDKLETLDLNRMASVIDEVYFALMNLE